MNKVEINNIFKKATESFWKYYTFTHEDKHFYYFKNKLTSSCDCGSRYIKIEKVEEIKDDNSRIN